MTGRMGLPAMVWVMLFMGFIIDSLGNLVKPVCRDAGQEHYNFVRIHSSDT